MMRQGTLVAMLALSTLATGLAQSAARADDEDPSFNFKLPDKVNKTGPDGREIIEDDEQSNIVPTAIRLDVEFPRSQGYLALQPGYIGLTQSGATSGLNFNIAEYVPLAFGFGGKVDFTQRVSFEANLAYARFTTSQQTTQKAVINASTASVVTANVNGFYCFNVGVTGLKICPGAGIGVDGFPIFSFVNSNTTVQLDSFSDMIVRGIGKLQYPLSGTSAVWLEGGYDYGFLKGASNGITTTSHRGIWGTLGFNTPISIKTDLLVGATLDNKSSSFTQNADTWTATGNVFSLTGGISYRF